nr:AAA family ATPase [Kibdelosporangium sp. MJ126-NF4]CEL19871.1 putative regulatory protein [Kibdelosporangium sp. MJ126-NF4]CTQ97095.1 putative regulatory protein [Kibdelosporangium sp. MJ126-NF4]
MALIERDRELARMDDLLALAAAGHGRTVLVEGPAGIGKTALLAAARERAALLGIFALTAVGGELELDLPFAVVRQLFEPSLRDAADDVLTGAAGLAAPVFGLDGRQADAGDPAALAGVVHGLYWVCSNLAERTPLLLAVDDVHWADEASLRFLSHLGRRIADLPVLLVLAGRPQPAGGGLDRALTGTTPELVGLRPLTDQAVGQVVRDSMAEDADDAFCRACARASGGNPFLLAEALTSLRADHVRPVAAEADRVVSLRPETISRAVLTRLARLGPDAIRLARALAVLGPAADLRRAALLAGIPDVTDVAETLAREDIVTSTRPIRFTHPLVRTAVYADGSDMLRAASHKRAALLLYDDGVPAEQLVPHLLAAEPESDSSVVGWLRTAAADAFARGAPEVAATCLQRALAEPPRAADRVDLLASLGRAMGMAHRPAEAADALREAYELAEDPRLRADLAMELGALMLQTGRGAETLASYDLVRRAIDDSDEEFLQQPHGALAMGYFSHRLPPSAWVERLDRLVPGLSHDTEADRMILATVSFWAAVTGDRSAEETGRLAAAAARGPLPNRDRWILVNFANAGLAVAGRLPESLDLLDRGIDDARSRGDATEFRYLCVLRSHTALYAGELLDAEADGRSALSLQEVDQSQESPLAVAVLVNALVERGELTEAQAILAEHDLEKPRPVSMLIEHFLLMARGRLRLAQNRPGDALDDLVECGRALAGQGYTNPGFAHWRAEAVMAHLALGHKEEATALATEEVELARRFGAPRGLGIALRSAAFANGGDLDLFEEAVSVLADSGARLDHARALVDYGAALRRAGHRTRAQQPLRAGLDLAARCGASPLVAQANAELIAVGARPRRDALTGVEALTASELRVARLAADGATNREIAQTLFVSRRTVEVHLTNTYRKLEIDSRAGLWAKLTRM